MFHFAATFSAFFLHQPRPPQGRSFGTDEWELKSPMRLKSFEPKSPLRLRRPTISFTSTLVLTWEPFCQLFANAFMSLVLFLISYSQAH
jgi:hypothetical protein